jgi:cell division initiation protein
VRLTPIDLLNKRFATSLRGYARGAVEDYLREIAADYEATVAENARLRETVENLEREIERYRSMETTLKEALILAQKTADETRAQAHREAEAVLREAQSRAAAVSEDAERRLEAVRQQRMRFAREFRATLQAYLDSLDGDARTRSHGSEGERAQPAARAVHGDTGKTQSPNDPISQRPNDPTTPSPDDPIAVEADGTH